MSNPNSPPPAESVGDALLSQESTFDSENDYLTDDGGNDEEVNGKIVKPLTKEALEEFNAAQERTGVIYISRIPPGMRPTKVRHLMSVYGEVGRVFLQQEDPKRTYLRKKYTTSKKTQYTEGWVEFKDKKVARSVANMLNAQPVGGKKGTRWRDDVWTMKYLPRFKWHMLTEQIAHEAAVHKARLRIELSQSRTEQHDYLKNVELARVLDKRAERKRKSTDADADADSNVAPDKNDSLGALHPAKRRAGEFKGKPKNSTLGSGSKQKDISDVISNVF